MTAIVDWDLAVSTGKRLARPGPEVTKRQAHDVVAELRELAVEADIVVRGFTQLAAPAHTEPVRIVDRPRWIAANVDGFRTLVDPLLDRLLAKRPPSPLTTIVAPKMAGVQVGTMLAYLSQRVLGQYELFLPPGQGAGRLTLVAPNIVEVERELQVDTRDFRMWVCLHEAAHRVQFTANPWLRDHLRTEISAYLDATDLDTAALLSRFKKIAMVIADVARGNRDVTLVEAVQTPEQKQILDRITGVMSLLEGHGEYVMNNVDASVVPTSAEIHRRFDARRQSSRPVDRAIRQLFGLDLKMKQYAEGAVFVDSVVKQVGMTSFNRVWESAETLPTRAEIRDPQAWIARVVGSQPAALDSGEPGGTTSEA